MKKTNVIFLSLLALLVSGCGKEKLNPSSTHYLTEDSSVQRDSSISSHETKASSSNPQKDSFVSSLPQDTSAGTSSQDPSSQEEDIYDSPWPSSIEDLMYAHLGGKNGILPYLDIHPSTRSSYYVPTDLTSWSPDDRHIEIYGQISFSDSLLTSLKSVFDGTDGWTASIEDSVLTAVNENLHLKVVVSNAGGLVLVKAYYQPLFEPSSGTKWKEDTLNIFDTYLGGHRLPYFYTGTLDEDITEPENKEVSSFQIVGGDYQAEILSLAKNAFEKDDKDGMEWNLTQEEGSLTASKKFQDEWEISVHVYEGETGKCIVEISFTSPFTLPSEEDSVWPDKVKQSMMDHLGFELPFLYLGVYQNISVDEEYWNYDRELIINTNGVYDSRVLTNAKTVLESQTDHTWQVEMLSDDNGETYLHATCLYHNDTNIEIVLSRNYDQGGMKLTIVAHPVYNPNHTSNIWQQATLDAFQTNLKGYTLPYVYLGMEKEEIIEDSTSLGKVTIRGGGYDNALITDLTSVLNADDGLNAAWTITSSDTTLQTLTARKVTSDEHTILTLTLSVDSHGLVNLAITYYSTPVNAGWSSSTLQAFEASLGTQDIPYLYLGTTKETASNSGNQVVVIGNRDDWTDNMAIYSEPILEADGWNASVSSNFVGHEFKKKLTANKTLEDGSTLKLVLDCDSYFDNSMQVHFTPRLTIKKVEPPEDPSSKTTWSSSIQTTLTDYLGEGNDLPYFNLGSSYISAKMDSTNTYLVLIGGNYSSQLLTSANTVLTQNGAAEISLTNVSVSGLFTFEEGTQAYVILDQNNPNDKQAELKIYKAKPSDGGSYPTNFKTSLQNFFGNYPLPYLDFGSTAPVEKTATGMMAFEYDMGVFNPIYLFHARDILKEDGFDVNLSSNSYGFTLSAKKQDDTYRYQISFYVMDNHIIADFYLSSAFIVPTGDDAKWNDEFLNTVDNNLFTDDTSLYIPYFYTGTMKVTPIVSSSTSCEFYGGTWDSEILTLAESAFDQDNETRKDEIQTNEDLKWTYTYESSTGSYPLTAVNPEGTLVATRKTSQGKTLTVRVFEGYSDQCHILIEYS